MIFCLPTSTLSKDCIPPTPSMPKEPLQRTLSSSWTSKVSPGLRRSPRRHPSPPPYGPVRTRGPSRMSPRRPIGQGRFVPGESTSGSSSGGSPQAGPSQLITPPVRVGQVVYQPPG